MNKSKIIIIFAIIVGIVVNQSCENQPMQYMSIANQTFIRTENMLDQKGAEGIEVAVKNEKKQVEKKRLYKSININEGRIGSQNGTSIDNPSDNVFKIKIDTLVAGEKAWLEYELYGLEDYSSVSRGINDQLSYGGLLVKINQKWSTQKEAIKHADIKQGENMVRFTVPERAGYGYKVKNVRIRVEQSTESSTQNRRLVINQPTTSYFYQNKGYIRGYVEGQGCEKAKIRIGDKTIRQLNGNFEGLIALEMNDSTNGTGQIEVEFEDGQKLQMAINYNKPVIYDYMKEAESHLEMNIKEIKKNESIEYTLGKLKLEGETGVISQPITLKGLSLRAIDMPVLGSGMVNVTGDYKGYRLLPHGTKFNKAIKISIPYDTNSLPSGYMAKDIRSYYFDETVNRWVALPLDTIDEKLCLVISYTNHFTDFVNGILKVPEAPQTSAYTPTTLSGIKAANPLESISMVSPPQVNNQGTANTSLPLNIPAGRNGMQPQLAISYNSGSANGRLGVGWDLSLPSINVETSWGVPRYSSSLETESYLLNGEQLSPQVQRESFKPRVSGTVEFFPRIKGSFSKIYRFGTNPTDYYWIIIDKAGTKYYYGKYSTESQVNSNCILKDANGNIAHWALCEVRDLNNNYVKYHYSVDNTKKITTNGNTGSQILPTYVTYTGFENTEGKYSVHFNYDDGNTKIDKTSSARYGFLQVETYLLDNITVKFNNQLVRDYYLRYKQGAFDKTLLCAIIERNDTTDNIKSILDNFDCAGIPSIDYVANNTQFHFFDYYGLPSNYYSDETLIEVELDEDMGFFETRKIENEPALGKSNTFSGGVGGGLSVGGGPETWWKSLSGGGSYSLNWSRTNIRATLIDIDGDGYPDRVFKQGGNFYYHKLIYNNGVYSYGPKTLLGTLNSLGKSKSNSQTWGLEGHIVVANASLSNTYTEGYTNIYFSDVNADGYYDLIDHEKVYINLPNSSGVPQFVEETGDTLYFGGSSCNYILRNTPVNPEVFDYSHGDNPIYGRDAVRMWIAPFDGTIQLYNTIQLIEDTSYSRRQSHFVDGIKYTIQHNGVEIKDDSINPNNYQPKYYSTQRTVNKGDRIYFRLQSYMNRNYDFVKWSPKIKYITDGNSEHVDSTIIDPNNYNSSIYQSNNDLLVFDKTKVKLPLAGIVNVLGDISTRRLSDDIRVLLIKNSNIIIDTILVNGTIHQLSIDEEVEVLEGDELNIYAYSNSTIEYQAIQSNIQIKYLYFNGDTIDPNSPYESINIKAPLIFNLYQEFVQKNKPILINSSGNVDFQPNLNLVGSQDGKIIFTVKKNETLLGKDSIEVLNGMPQNSPIISVNLNAGDLVFCEFFTNNSILAYDLLHSKVSYDNNDYDIGIQTQMNDSMWKFGNLHRGWGQFSYKGSESAPIDESLLYLSDTYKTGSFTFDTTGLSNSNYNSINTSLNNANINNPKDEPFNMMFVDRDSIVYRDYARYSSISGNEMSNSFRTRFDTDTFYDSPIIIVNKPSFKVKTVLLETYSEDSSWNYNQVGGPISQGLSVTNGYNRNIMNYMDMNGDRYPDILGIQTTQYTYPQGNYDSDITNPPLLYSPYNDRYSGGGPSYGVNLPVISKAFSGSVTFEDGTSTYTVKAEVKEESSWSLGANVASSFNNSDYGYLDINGDGLPDRINDDGKVYYNMGYAYKPSETWSFNSISSGGSVSYAMNAGYGSSLSTLTELIISDKIEKLNLIEYSWSAGFGGSYTNNKNNYQLSDINGDGLPDKIYVYGDSLFASFNTGSGFTSPKSLGLKEVEPSQGHSFHVGVNVAGSYGFSVLAAKVVASLQGTASESFSTEKKSMMDINNDGYLDIVSATNDGLKVRFSNLGDQNLLKKIITPSNAEISLTYELAEPNANLPYRKKVLKSVYVDDNFSGDGVDVTKTVFDYIGGYYDRFEREFYGFDTIKTHQYNSAVANPYIYRSNIDVYVTDDYYIKGNLLKNVLLDSLNDTLAKTVYKYNEFECGLSLGPDFPAVVQIDKYFYDNSNTVKIHTKQNFDYDTLGNVILFTDHGDVAHNNDDITSEILYSHNFNLNIIGLPTSVNVKRGATVLRNRSASYDMSTGQLNSLDIQNTASTSRFSMNYNSYGNLSSILMPENYSNQALSFRYYYDDVVHTYPDSIVNNSFNLYSTTEYDFRIGAPTKTKDVSGNEIQYDYYIDGRLKTVKGPNEIQNNIPYLIKFEYNKLPFYSGFYPINPNGNGILPFAVTKHYDPLNQNNEFTTIMISDGLGRPVQTKQSALIDDKGSKVPKWVVSGKQIYDAYGRVIESYQPTVDILSNSTIISTTTSSITPTRVYYDALDRTTKVKMPDNTENLMEYGFGNDAFGLLTFMNQVTDANGVSIKSFTNAQGKQTTIKAPHYATTKFIYSPLGELIESIDPENYSTTYSYDLAGQLVSRTHPDAGTTSYTYDNAGNLLTTQTANLAGLNEFIQYSYDYNRLTQVTYPQNPENNVYYEYGTTGNETGRITKVQDASTIQQFSYGMMGEVIENIRTFVVPGGQDYTFAMNFEYDSWNRIKTMTYPDGEVVAYGYDIAGQLSSVVGDKGTSTYRYIDDIYYDPFGSRTRVDYGNGTQSRYTYDAVMRQLTNLKTYDASSNLIQNISYNYDDVSNISTIANAAGSVSGLGGAYSYSYQYDSLYRLVNSAGSFTDNSQNTYPYTQSMNYTASGNILNKQTIADKLLDGNALSVNNQYDYQYDKHRITQIQMGGGSKAFNWDLNGNMITATQTTDITTTRSLCWDEENRLMGVKDQNYLSNYIYDAGGERVWKLTGRVEQLSLNGGMVIDVANLNNKTLYTSPYMVITDQEYTKHYYAGTQRIASKLGAGFGGALVDMDVNVETINADVETITLDLVALLERTNTCARIESGNVTMPEPNLPAIEALRNTSIDNLESDMYFYHSDHLGSSSWITDASGAVNQHLQYLPFGEDYIYQRTNTWNIPYTFSGKEKDAETGYSYFGARYYDSELSVWLSVDPMSDKRLGLSSYNYCQLNPIMRIDPTGNIDVEGVGHNRGRISRYKRKAIRMANKSGLNWNNPSDRSQIHSAMREKYKGRRFMYLETGNSNQDHYGGWYTTSSFLDSQDGIQSISYVSKKEKPNLIPTVDDNKSTTWDFEAKGEYGDIYIDIVPYDDGTKTSVPFYFSVFDQDGNEVVKSKNLSKNGISLHFTRSGSFSIFYSPSEEAQHHDGTDKSKTWSAPVISVSIVNYYQVSKTKQPAIVGSSYISFRKFLKSERKN